MNHHPNNIYSVFLRESSKSWFVRTDETFKGIFKYYESFKNLVLKSEQQPALLAFSLIWENKEGLLYVRVLAENLC